MKESRKNEKFRYVGSGYQSLTEAFLDEMNLFIDVLTYICETVTKYEGPKNEYILNKSLFFVLNMTPLLEKQRADYYSIFDKGYNTSTINNLKEKLVSDLARVLSVIRRSPIMYDQPEKDIAELHFNGAFGKGIPHPSDYKNVECSPAVRMFDLDVYKRVRSAFTVEELIQIESGEGKYHVLYILAGYYISKYYEVVTDALRRAGLKHLFIDFSRHPFVQDKLEWILMRLTNENYYAYVDTEESNPISKTAKKELLSKKFCKTENQKAIIKLLDGIREDFQIGTKACSKKRFCEIVFVFTEYMMDCWEVHKFAPNRRLLARYYGINEPTYKISECRKFKQSEDGKNLIHKIQKFCAEH